MEGFTIEGWDDFVENFSKFVDKWADKKKILLQRMANIYHGEVIPHVPVDTSRLVDSITIFGEGIPHDFVEVGTNVEYALYVNDGHVQHKRFLPADKLSVPLYFRYGYSKAKIYCLIPFVLVMLFVMLPSFIGSLANIISFAMEHDIFINILSILISLFILGVSYCFSIRGYKKRK